MVVGGGVRRGQVVAVVARLQDGREQVGSGYLVGPGLVLTAHHCTRDAASEQRATGLSVIGAEDGRSLGEVTVVAADSGLDVAVLRLASAPVAELDVPVYARVDRGRSGMLLDCEAIGYPLFQRDPGTRIRGTSEVHGVIYQTDGVEAGRLLLREPLIRPGAITGGGQTGADGASPWGGLSGALVFHAGRGLGVIVEHHPRQGEAALQVVAFDTIARLAVVREDARRIAELLGLPAAEDLPVAAAEPMEPLADLVDVLAGEDLPSVADLNPYVLGTTDSNYGDQSSHGERDPYVPRTHGAVDSRLRVALEPGRLVIVTGPSKAGKTRTAYEAVRSRWPGARLLAPVPAALGRLVDHPRLQTSDDPIVVWLDDLDRFLTISEPLTPSALNRLTARRGPTVVVATMRQEARARLVETSGELTRDARQLLQAAAEIDLQRTGDDPAEQAAAMAAYPAENLAGAGLAEQLAGAPALLRRYRDDRQHDPLRHAVVQVAIDWARVGMPRPITEDDLCELALDTLWNVHPELDYARPDALKAIATARRPPDGAGQVAMLTTYPGPDRTRSYRAFDYLVAADDGQDSTPRPIPDLIWDQALKRCSPDEAFAVGYTAYQRNLIPHAISAYAQAAEAGHTGAMNNLGNLLADRLDPPDLETARSWFERAADTGHTGAMNHLGNLLATRLDPPDLETARGWFERAAEAGDAGAMYNLGILLADPLAPAYVETARDWFERAAEAGNTGAMYNLGILLATQQDPPDLETARGWFERAAEAGNTDAMNSLGFLLASQLDPPDLETARGWFERAAEAGNTDAMNNLGILLADRLDPPDLETARGWFERAAEAGDAGAMYNLGNLLVDWLDPPDLETARGWFERAAEAGDAGDAGAMNNLGILLADRLDPPDLETARGWFERAAEAGDADAMNNLGFLLADRLDPPDLGTARGWFERAAEAGHADAMTNLGYLLATQLDPPDLVAAREWWRSAANLGHAAAQEALDDLG